MRKRINLRFLSLLTVFAIMLSCFATTLNANTAQAAKKLKVKSPKTVAINCKIAIKSNQKATYKSSNTKIATVNKKGVVTGKKAGKVKITVTSKKNKKQKKTVKITVKKNLIITSPSNLKITLKVGQTFKVKQNLKSAYESSNTDVAVVNKNGVVTGKKSGTAKIAVIDKKYGLKKTIFVSVIKNGDTPQKTVVTVPPSPTKEPLVTQKPLLTQEPLVTQEPSATPTSTPENKTPISISATYVGETVPYYGYIDYINKLNVTAKYADGTSKDLKYPEYELSNKLCKKIGTNVITITYKGLETTFEVSVKETSYDYIDCLVTTFLPNTHPMDISNVKVTLSSSTSGRYLTTGYIFDYLGIKEIDNVQYHSYIFYYSEDFVDEDGVKFHSFVYHEKGIPID